MVEQTKVSKGIFLEIWEEQNLGLKIPDRIYYDPSRIIQLNIFYDKIFQGDFLDDSEEGNEPMYEITKKRDCMVFSLSETNNAGNALL